MVNPSAAKAGFGEIEIDSSIAALTVSVVFADVAPDVAVMTVEPTAMAVARPVALTVAALSVPEVQVTLLVKSAAVLLL